MATRTLIETQTKMIKKELSKEKNPISNKIVIFKNNKTVQNFTITGLT